MLKIFSRNILTRYLCLLAAFVITLFSVMVAMQSIYSLVGANKVLSLEKPPGNPNFSGSGVTPFDFERFKINFEYQDGGNKLEVSGPANGVDATRPQRVMYEYKSAASGGSYSPVNNPENITAMKRLWGLDVNQSNFIPTRCATETVFIYSFILGAKARGDIVEAAKAAASNNPADIGLDKKAHFVPGAEHAVMSCGRGLTTSFPLYLYRITNYSDSGNTGGGTGKVGGYDVANNLLTRADFGSGRFIFISSLSVYDRKYSTEYTALDPDGSLPDGITIQDGNDVLFNGGGALIFRPVGTDKQPMSKTSSGNCLGFFALETTNEGGKYLLPRYVSVTQNAGRCQFGSANQFDVETYSGLATGAAAVDINKNPVIAEMGSADSIARRLSYSTFRWNSPTEIETQIDNGRITLKLFPEDQTKDFAATLQLPSPRGKWTFWTSDACRSSTQNGKRNTLVAIDYDASAKSLTDFDTAHPHSVGFIFTGLGDGSGWKPNWNGESMKCLLGHEVKQNGFKKNQGGAYGAVFGPSAAYNDDNGVLIAGIGESDGTPGGGASDSSNNNTVGAGNVDNLGTGGDDITCETSKGSALSFVICPIINGGSNFVDWVFDTVVVPFLEEVPISAKADSQTFQVWAGFRFIANILLIMVLLAVIIGASTGGGNS